MQVKQSEEFWNKSYFQTSKHFEKNIKNISGIFVAFNTNLDAIKYVDSTLLNFLDIGKFAAKDDCREIHKLDDFKTGLLSSMESGKAMEWQIKDSKTYNYLLDNIKFNTHRIGGQAGIVSNVLAHIGMKNIVVFNPGCSEAEADMYDSRISSPKFSGNSLRLIPANDAYSVHDTPKINFIFEFDKGLKIRSGNKTFTVPRKNRFIVSSRPKGRDPFFPEQILHAHNFSSFFKNIKRVFLSGYQYLSTDKQFFMAKIQLAFIRKTNPDMKIHYEFTSEENLKNVARIIKYILPEVDSLGCNERETCILLDAAGKKNLADTIRDSAYSAAELFEGVRFLKNMAGLKRMHVHNIDYMLCLADKG
ncbi:MAG: ADP-dependent glucokinase/phosphofructokinase, partial [archaeon]|nr:ADP-dependent glucokinase/phosphofructokinase [archaeon]